MYFCDNDDGSRKRSGATGGASAERVAERMRAATGAMRVEPCRWCAPRRRVYLALFA